MKDHHQHQAYWPHLKHKKPIVVSCPIMSNTCYIYVLWFLHPCDDIHNFFGLLANLRAFVGGRTILKRHVFWSMPLFFITNRVNWLHIRCTVSVCTVIIRTHTVRSNLALFTCSHNMITKILIHIEHNTWTLFCMKVNNTS